MTWQRSNKAASTRLPTPLVFFLTAVPCGPFSPYNLFIMSRRNGTAVLERLLAPVSQSLNVDAARKLVRLKADAQTQARMDELAGKCNEGELSPAERSEYERYVTAGNLIAILQAQARLLLTQKS